MRRAAKRDDNHAEIRDTLRDIPGVVVADTGSLGGGFPDLVVGYRGVVHLLEIKDGSKPPSKRKLTPDEVKFFNNWAGFPVHVVASFDEALRAIQEER